LKYKMIMILIMICIQFSMCAIFILVYQLKNILKKLIHISNPHGALKG
ncbi:MAG: hypothetical protein ACI9U5_001343, partial [Colwellia sp.]